MFIIIYINPFFKIKQEILTHTELFTIYSKKREKLEHKIQSLSQQLNLFSYETLVLKEIIKDSMWMFNKEVAETLIRIKKPSQESQYIAENFLLMLHQTETTWKAFQVFLYLKNDLLSL